MTRTLSVAAALLLLASGPAPADERFEKTAVRFEQNATDHDAEVTFEAVGNGSGLAALRVIAPNGRVVVDFKAPDSSLGLRQVKLESPEPRNDGRIQADFPEGAYTFSGHTVTGVKLRGRAVLSHKLPEAAAIVHPLPGAKGVPVKGLRIRWNGARDLAASLVAIEQEETGHRISARLPGGATSFEVPEGFLLPGREYKLEIGTVSGEGNASFVESAFTTAGGRR